MWGRVSISNLPMSSRQIRSNRYSSAPTKQWGANNLIQYSHDKIAIYVFLTYPQGLLVVLQCWTVNDWNQKVKSLTVWLVNDRHWPTNWLWLWLVPEVIRCQVSCYLKWMWFDHNSRLQHCSTRLLCYSVAGFNTCHWLAQLLVGVGHCFAWQGYSSLLAMRWLLV